jgi:hypothetical protein
MDPTPFFTFNLGCEIQANRHLFRETGPVFWPGQRRRQVRRVFRGFEYFLIVITGKNFDVLNFTSKVLPNKNDAGDCAITEWWPPVAYHMILYFSEVLIPRILRARFDRLARCG